MHKPLVQCVHGATPLQVTGDKWLSESSIAAQESQRIPHWGYLKERGKQDHDFRLTSAHFWLSCWSDWHSSYLRCRLGKSHWYFQLCWLHRPAGKQNKAGSHCSLNLHEKDLDTLSGVICGSRQHSPCFHCSLNGGQNRRQLGIVGWQKGGVSLLWNLVSCTADGISGRLLVLLQPVSRGFFDHVIHIAVLVEREMLDVEHELPTRLKGILNSLVDGHLAFFSFSRYFFRTSLRASSTRSLV